VLSKFNERCRTKLLASISPVHVFAAETKEQQFLTYVNVRKVFPCASFEATVGSGGTDPLILNLGTR